MNSDFDASLMSRLFYFTMHVIIWITLILYSKNPFIKNLPSMESLIFILLVLYSNYLFVTVGDNPGYCIKNDCEDDLELQEV